MIKTVTFSEFCDSFGDSYKHNFTYEGKRALYDYLEELETQTNEPIELDIVALCCDYTEYESEIEAAENYFTYESAAEGTLEENEKLAHIFLEDNTTVIPVGKDGKVIIANF